MESSEEGEKKVLVIDMSRAREAQRPQFLAVGLYPVRAAGKPQAAIRPFEEGMENAWGFGGQPTRV